MADEEALFVVVGIDEPAGDAVGAVADDFVSSPVKETEAKENFRFLTLAPY